jgi:hypothetical protein
MKRQNKVSIMNTETRAVVVGVNCGGPAADGLAALLLLPAMLRRPERFGLWHARLGGVVLGVVNAVTMALTLVTIRQLGAEVVFPVAVATPILLMLILDVEWHRMANLLQMQGTNGLFWIPLAGRPWAMDDPTQGGLYNAKALLTRWRGEHDIDWRIFPRRFAWRDVLYTAIVQYYYPGRPLQWFL